MKMNVRFIRRAGHSMRWQAALPGRRGQFAKVICSEKSEESRACRAGTQAWLMQPGDLFPLQHSPYNYQPACFLFR